jgi:cytochrome c5
MIKTVNILFTLATIFVISCGTKKLATSTAPTPPKTPTVAVVEKKVVKAASVLQDSVQPITFNINANKLLAGKQIYTANCGKCHELYNSKKFNAVQWAEILNRMEIKAGISNAQRRMIEDYLVNG